MEIIICHCTALIDVQKQGMVQLDIYVSTILRQMVFSVEIFIRTYFLTVSGSLELSQRVC